jgi:hypothetical protein
MKKILLTILAVVAAGFTTVPLHATIITYDGFDYTSGDDINGQNGGTAWNGAWNVNTGSSATVQSSSPLSYGSLVTTGNYVQGNGYQKVGRKVNEQFLGPWDTAGYISNPFGLNQLDQGTVWASLLIRRDKDVGAFEGLSVYFHQDFTGNSGLPSNSPVHFSIDNTDQSWQVQNMGGTQTQLSTSAIGDTNLLVVKFELSLTAGANNIYLWLNPSFASLGGADLNVATADWSATGLNTADARFRSFAVETGGGSTGSYDEIRFGTTYASVTPIPEPSTAFLIVAGLAALALTRRRRTSRS